MDRLPVINYTKFAVPNIRTNTNFTQPHNAVPRTANEIIIFGKAPPRQRMKYHPSYHSSILAIYEPRPAEP